MDLLLIALLVVAAGWRGECLQGLRTLRNTIEENLVDSAQLQQRRCVFQVNQPCASKYSGIRFILYSRGRQKYELDLKHKYLPESFDPRANMKVIIHGFSSYNFMDGIVQGYLARGEDSVLVVDWSRLSRKPCYLSAKVNTRHVGRCTGEALAALRPSGHLHVVGFSLGAHVAGHTSAFLAKHHGLRVHRITGLDPALPLYATPLDERKLDKSDAGFVDVIHTDPGIYGKAEPSGHVDFYINGVSIQPGCYNATNPPLCSHKRATEVFAESINSEKGFWGVRCPSLFYYLSGYCTRMRNSTKKALMGEYTDPRRNIFCFFHGHDRLIVRVSVGSFGIYSFNHLFGLEEYTLFEPVDQLPMHWATYRRQRIIPDAPRRQI